MSNSLQFGLPLYLSLFVHMRPDPVTTTTGPGITSVPFIWVKEGYMRDTDGIRLW